MNRVVRVYEIAHNSWIRGIMTLSEVPLEAPPNPVRAVGFKLSARLLELVDRAAREGHRTRSHQLRRYVLEGLRRDGLLDAQEAA